MFPQPISPTFSPAVDSCVSSGVCIRYYVLPENVEASLPELQAIATQYSAVTKEIWATEYGWSTNDERARYSVAKYVVVRLVSFIPPHHERTRSGNTSATRQLPGTPDSGPGSVRRDQALLVRRGRWRLGFVRSPQVRPYSLSGNAKNSR